MSAIDSLCGGCDMTISCLVMFCPNLEDPNDSGCHGCETIKNIYIH